MTNVSDTGIVVLDTNCYRALDDSATRRRVVRSLRAADLTLWPSAVNAFELSATSRPDLRDRLLETITEVTDGRPLLPWPTALLESLARAAAEGEPNVIFKHSDADALIRDPTEALLEHERIDAFHREVERKFDELHDQARPEIQEFLKANQLRWKWSSAPAFLDEQWMTSSMAEHLAALYWNGFGLTGAVPHTRLLELPAWKFFLEAEGIAVFERSVMFKKPKRVHRLDLLQVVYLAGSFRRIFVTADKPLLRAASAILHRRHENARAMHVDQFIAVNT